jgi:hypothetical protein
VELLESDYAEHGARKQLRLGNSLWKAADYNTRLQPVAMSLGSTKGAIDRWRIDLDYGLIGSNNGNLVGLYPGLLKPRQE